MKIATLFLVFLGFCLSANAQTVTFHSNDDKIKASRGSTVVIEADTAYIISSARAHKLNRQLDELGQIKRIYNQLLTNRNKLLRELTAIEETLGKVVLRMEADSGFLNQNMTGIIADIDRTLLELKQNNETLATNNRALSQKVDALSNLVKNLRKETRWIWWNGLADKIVVFGAGIGVGAIAILILL
ncbi:MAG: hypothetical protein PF489_02140 [Salinivirgaceae bacterium]|jgi:Skp family chaperone for outer membrane proteins|nr:hypothetical protein [Salinivirgaceae bacterium]